MKILWHSNAPWAPTGYGNQTGLFIQPVAEEHEVAVSTFYGLQGARLKWDGVPIFPGHGGDFGNGYLLAHASHWFDGDLRSGLLLTLMDVWVLNVQEIAQTHAACWVPVDHEPAPPAVKKFFQESGAIPLTMSRFGEAELAEFDPIYVPHGVDVDKLKPHPKAACRKETGVPADAFLVGMVAANQGRSPSRKGFQQAFEAFAEFRRRHDDALLYLHTIMDPSVGQGEDLRVLLASYGIPPESVLLADQYRQRFDPMPSSSMAKIYSTMDVLLSPSMGEGFGIPIVEAQACGVPVIGTNFSAMKETISAGWKVSSTGFWTGQQSWQAMPDVGELIDALEDCHSLSAADRKDLSRRARSHAMTYSSVKVLRDHLLPALAEVEERIGEQPQLKAVAA